MVDQTSVEPASRRQALAREGAWWRTRRAKLTLAAVMVGVSSILVPPLLVVWIIVGCIAGVWWTFRRAASDTEGAKARAREVEQKLADALRAAPGFAASQEHVPSVRPVRKRQPVAAAQAVAIDAAQKKLAIATYDPATGMARLDVIAGDLISSVTTEEVKSSAVTRRSGRGAATQLSLDERLDAMDLHVTVRDAADPVRIVRFQGNGPASRGTREYDELRNLALAWRARIDMLRG